MPIPASILERIETFGRNLESYLSPDYKETELRREFLDPLFAALGWDVANTAGHAEAYKDVVHEDSLKIGGGNATAPDYSFRIGGLRKFFVEAKKPAVRVKDDPEPAKQLRRYSWSAKLPLGIVTDFHEFAIYDTRIRPKENDKASTARIFYCTYEQYPEKWDEIAAIFSKEAVLRGSFDQYASATRGKGGTAEFDDAFLADMEAWRELLARNLALRNARLSQRDLNFAVQRILDRIVFLRIAEDRGIEKFGQLLALTAGPRLYPRFCDLCRRADARYNSGLFHFEAERDRAESPDRLTLDLEIDDAVLKEILSALYYPRSPYAFAVIPADILGHVYEQFLGKVIHLTEGHRAKVEEKPEVRKAGGVYYTPTYIVDYIVSQTLGPLLAGRTPKQVEKLRVLDPACGSGSFLLGAFDHLLDWHLRYYLANDPEGWARRKHPPIYEANPNAHRDAFGQPRHPQAPVRTRNWHLTTAERKRILLNNLFGVDIDAQAVEVTKLSLLLKVLEGEARELQGKQTTFERVLPDLGQNIKCGNSLIGSDFYSQPDLPTLDDEARIRINAFDWDTEFKPIMDAGGFDAVIGNPPYDVLEKERGAASWPHAELADYAQSIEALQPALGGKLNLFRFFVVKSTALSRPGGNIGMIVPLALLADISTSATRRHFFSQTTELVADCFPQKDVASRRVFRDAKLSTVVLSAKKRPKPDPVGFQITVRVYPWNSFDDPARTATVTATDLALFDAKNLPVPLVSAEQLALCRKLCSQQDVIRLGDVRGIEVTRGEINQTIYRSFITEQRTGCRLIKGAEIGRYFERKVLKQGIREWLDEKQFLKECGSRPVVLQDRIATQRITGVDERWRIVATIVSRGAYFADSTNSIAVTNPGAPTLPYLLALMNSRLWQWRFKLTSSNNNVGTNELECMPLHWPSSGTKRVSVCQQFAPHVSRMLQLHEQLAAARSPHEQTRLQRDIAVTDRAIDQLVYQLYGLTPEEIALVEAATAPGGPTAAEPAPAAGGGSGYGAHFLAREDRPEA